MSGLRRLLQGVSQALCRGALQQKAAGLQGGLAEPSRGPAAFAAARLAAAAPFSSCSSSSAATGGVRHLLASSSWSSGSGAALGGAGCGGAAAAAAALATPHLSWVARTAASGAAVLQQLRTRTSASHLKVKFAGGKIKPYSSFKSRFKLTGTGKIKYPRAGHVHKRFNKSKSQLFELSGTQLVKPRYAKAMKLLNFKMHTY